MEALDAHESDVETVNHNENYSIQKYDEVLQSAISESQFKVLQGRTPRKYIKVRPGKGGKNFSYVPHGYVTAVLNKAFGFDWDFEIIPQADGKIYAYIEGQPEQSRPASIIVHGKLTVRIHYDQKDLSKVVTIIKASTGEKEVIKGMTWGGMIKSAESDAFKKAASRLGVALDLYWQDADEDYIPVEELSPEQQAMMKDMKEVYQEIGNNQPPFKYKDAMEARGHTVDMNDIMLLLKKVKNGNGN
jgi:recombination DNA repair RAD52 pathway protein